MNEIPKNVSESVRRRNPHLYGPVVGGVEACQPKQTAIPTLQNRIRQNSKPLMNKLETEFYNRTWSATESKRVHIQAITFKLANGLRYTPDFVWQDICDSRWQIIAYEVKGAWVDGDSFPKLKMAATVFPEITWLLVWKESGVWKEQRVLA